MNTEALIALCQMDLPSGTVRLCDGGYVTWAGNTFKATDATYGTLASVRALGEGVGDQIPALEMVLQPASAATAGSLVQPGYQKSRIRFWIANFNQDTAAVTGTPSLVFDGFYDQAILGVGKSRRDLAITVVSLLEQLFEANIGNRLSPAWHKSIWPGETGQDNATGLNMNIAWGVEAPPSTATPAGGVVAGGTYTKDQALAMGLRYFLMTPDLIRRHTATAATMNKYRKKDFSWENGVTCVHLASFHLGKMGHRRPPLPKFRSPLGALRALKTNGWADCTQMLDSLRSISRVTPAMMLMGDVAVLTGGVSADDESLEGAQEVAGIGAVVICAGPHKVFGWREDVPQMVVLDIGFDEISAAWRL